MDDVSGHMWLFARKEKAWVMAVSGSSRAMLAMSFWAQIFVLLCGDMHLTFSLGQWERSIISIYHSVHHVLCIQSCVLETVTHINSTQLCESVPPI